jgi:hypothetical protein
MVNFARSEHTFWPDDTRHLQYEVAAIVGKINIGQKLIGLYVGTSEKNGKQFGKNQQTVASIKKYKMISLFFFFKYTKSNIK